MRGRKKQKGYEAGATPYSSLVDGLDYRPEVSESVISNPDQKPEQKPEKNNPPAQPKTTGRFGGVLYGSSQRPKAGPRVLPCSDPPEDVSQAGDTLDFISPDSGASKAIQPRKPKTETEFALAEIAEFARALILTNLDVERACQVGGFSFTDAVAIRDHPDFPEIMRMVIPDPRDSGLVGPAAVVAEVSALAFSDATDLFEKDEKGRLVVKDFKDMSWLTRRAIKSIDVEERRLPVGVTVCKVKVIMHDKMSALNALRDVVFPKRAERDRVGGESAITINDFAAKFQALERGDLAYLREDEHSSIPTTSAATGIIPEPADSGSSSQGSV